VVPRPPAEQVHYIVAVDVISGDDDVAEVKANSEHDGFFTRLAPIGLDHSLLEVYGRAERVHGAGELDQTSIALDPYHSTAAARGSWREALGQVFQEPRNRAAFVPAHQPRRSNRVGKEDRR